MGLTRRAITQFFDSPVRGLLSETVLQKSLVATLYAHYLIWLGVHVQHLNRAPIRHLILA